MEKTKGLFRSLHGRIASQLSYSAFLAVICIGLYSCNRNERGDEGPSPEKTPEQELATFQLAAGLKIQLVAAEPMIQDPVVMTFDPMEDCGL